MTQIYLCGPIQGRTDAQCVDWREAVTDTFPGLTIDPMQRDYRGHENENVATIVEGDKRDIARCKIVLVMYDGPSVGTSMEMLYAFERKKYVITVNITKAPVSPWLIYHSHYIYNSVGEAIECIKDLLHE